MGGSKETPEILLKKDVFVTTNMSSLLEAEMRLDAPYFSEDYMRAVSAIQSSPYPTTPLIDLCEDIFRLTRFKRVWSDKEHGYQYAAPKDLVYFKPFREQDYPNKAFVARGKHGDRAKIKSALGSQSPMRKKKGEDVFFVDSGWILITCSGSVGRLMLVTDSLSKVFFTHDLIRIIPKKETLVGYLYAYLSSWIGQTFLKRDQYGGWVKHIEPHQIKSLPVLLPSKETRKEIHDLVMDAFRHRERFLKKEELALDKIDTIVNTKS